MRVIRDSSPHAFTGAVAALGNFDGLHLGHQAVLAEAAALARQSGKPAMMVTFEPHPRRVFHPDSPRLNILPLRDKIRLASAFGMDCVRIFRFTRAFARIGAVDFVTRILHEELGITHAVTGEDFVFGRNREGDADRLRSMAGAAGFSVTFCPPVTVGGARCSSTRIREALAAGNMEAAAALLGRPYTLAGRVREGDKRGRALGFPTANMLPSPLFLPAYGVYAVRASVRGKTLSGVASLGIRPHFPLAAPLLEVHLFDWSEPIYGERMEVECVRYLREERKFKNIQALKEQIARDCEAAMPFRA